jgi:hypothetical protein
MDECDVMRYVYILNEECNGKMRKGKCGTNGAKHN